MALTEAATAAIVAGSSAAASIAGSAINSAVSTRRGYKYTNALMQRQNEINLQNWSIQNQYNSPAAQMQRLQEAGLNPMLVYGNGQASTGNAGAVSSPSGSQFKVDEMIDAQSLAQLVLQSRGLALDNQRKAMDNDLAAEELAQQKIQTQMRNLYKQALALYASDKAGTTDELTKDLSDATKQELRNTPFYMSFEKMNLSNEQISHMLLNIDARTSLTDKQGEVLDINSKGRDAANNLFDGNPKTLQEVVLGLAYLLFGGNGIINKF